MIRGHHACDGRHVDDGLSKRGENLVLVVGRQRESMALSSPGAGKGHNGVRITATTCVLRPNWPGDQAGVAVAG